MISLCRRNLHLIDFAHSFEEGNQARTLNARMMMKKNLQSVRTPYCKVIIYTANVAEDHLADEGTSNDYVILFSEYAAERW